MSEIPGLFSSFTAGILSFLSPCVLPLIPVYLSFISGESLSLDSDSKKSNKLQIFIRTLYFVVGFTIVFVALAILLHAGMNLAGATIAVKLKKIAGALVVLLGINMIFDFIPFLRMEARGQANKLQAKAAGPIRSLLFGMLFGAGWTPCIGPILATILFYAGQSENSMHAIMLLSMYSLGIGLPFILTGLFINQVTPLLDFLKRKGSIVKIISGILIILFGALMFLGKI